jgi:hypothetical protein
MGYPRVKRGLREPGGFDARKEPLIQTDEGAMRVNLPF